MNETAATVRSRWVYVMLLALLSYRWHAHSMFSQLGNTVLEYTATDVLYVSLRHIGFFGFISANQSLQFTLDVSLFILPVAGLVLPESRWVPRVVLLIFSTYIFCFNAATGHHYHGLFGMWLMLLTICFDGERHRMIWQAARYYLCFIFTSAACWKLMRGSAFNEWHMQHILQTQHAQLLFEQPLSLHSLLIKKILALPAAFGHSVYLSAIALQLSFALGFLTQNKDRLLAILLVLFVSANYALMNIVSAELLVLLPLLLHGRPQQTSR